jgi:hypothetical protein
MKNLIRKILKEDFDWTEEAPGQIGYNEEVSWYVMKPILNSVFEGTDYNIDIHQAHEWAFIGDGAWTYFDTKIDKPISVKGIVNELEKSLREGGDEYFVRDFSGLRNFLYEKFN